MLRALARVGSGSAERGAVRLTLGVGIAALAGGSAIPAIARIRWIGATSVGAIAGFAMIQFLQRAKLKRGFARRDATPVGTALLTEIKHVGDRSLTTGSLVTVGVGPAGTWITDGGAWVCLDSPFTVAVGRKFTPHYGTVTITSTAGSSAVVSIDETIPVGSSSGQANVEELTRAMAAGLQR